MDLTFQYDRSTPRPTHVYTPGINWGYSNGSRIPLIYENGYYAIWKVPSTSFWNGQGSTAFSPTEYKLMRITEIRAEYTYVAIELTSIEPGKNWKKEVEKLKGWCDLLSEGKILPINVRKYVSAEELVHIPVRDRIGGNSIRIQAPSGRIGFINLPLSNFKKEWTGLIEEMYKNDVNQSSDTLFLRAVYIMNPFSITGLWWRLIKKEISIKWSSLKKRFEPKGAWWIPGH